MSEKEIISIADNADMIINGFSFTANEDGLEISQGGVQRCSGLSINSVTMK